VPNYKTWSHWRNRPAALGGSAVYIVRIATVHLIGGLVFITALTGTALSMSDFVKQKYRDAEEQLHLCYNAGAIKYAAQTCEPAASIVMAVHGNCARFERDLRHAVELDDQSPEFSQAVLNDFRKEVEPELYSLILDTRANSADKCQ
jgi:hypothetical protein